MVEYWWLMDKLLQVICELNFTNTILRVKMNQKRSDFKHSPASNDCCFDIVLAHDVQLICSIQIVQFNPMVNRMVVVLETRIYIFDVASMKILHTLDTPRNPHGWCL